MLNFDVHTPCLLVNYTACGIFFLFKAQSFEQLLLRKISIGALIGEDLRKFTSQVQELNQQEFAQRIRSICCQRRMCSE